MKKSLQWAFMKKKAIYLRYDFFWIRATLLHQIIIYTFRIFCCVASRAGPNFNPAEITDTQALGVRLCACFYGDRECDVDHSHWMGFWAQPWTVSQTCLRILNDTKLFWDVNIQHDKLCLNAYTNTRTAVYLLWKSIKVWKTMVLTQGDVTLLALIRAFISCHWRANPTETNVTLFVTLVILTSLPVFC